MSTCKYLLYRCNRVKIRVLFPLINDTNRNSGVYSVTRIQRLRTSFEIYTHIGTHIYDYFTFMVISYNFYTVYFSSGLYFDNSDTNYRESRKTRKTTLLLTRPYIYFLIIIIKETKFTVTTSELILVTHSSSTSLKFQRKGDLKFCVHTITLRGSSVVKRYCFSRYSTVKRMSTI